MKKKYLLVSILSLGLLVGCNENTNVNYYEVNYQNNYENGGYFKNIVVNKNGTLKRPNNPSRDGYVFLGWSTKEDKFEEFNGFDAPITSNLNLYAFWKKDDETFTSLEKAKLFKKYISWVEEPTIEASRNSEILISYYQPTEISGGFEGRDVFKRYKDYTESTSYITDDNDLMTPTSKTIYSYDDKNFTKSYEDLTDSSQNKITTTPFKEDQKEEFLNIGFYNLNIRDFDKIITNLEANKTEEDLFYYSIDKLNLTKFDSNSAFFEFAFDVEVDTYNEEQGLTYQDLRAYEGSIHFKNNKIYKSKVIYYNATAVSGELIMQQEITDEITYVSGDINRVK